MRQQTECGCAKNAVATTAETIYVDLDACTFGFPRPDERLAVQPAGKLPPNAPRKPSELLDRVFE